ncbi:hypothetical protein [Pilimelia anulata]|uniref:hypothetical protein n=1 Tax=Pilimelia anulata TaxID=53371 RepID=UPI00166C98EA|nr:hypothetical protein [Pilimelia anulata]
MAEVERLVPIDEHPPVFFALAEMIQSEELALCEQLCTELERVSNKGQAHLFVKQGKGQSLNRGADYNRVRVVMARHQFIDPMDHREYCAPYVLAQALELRDEGHRVVVITEDRFRKVPPLVSMAQAAESEQLATLGTAAFLGNKGIWSER